MVSETTALERLQTKRERLSEIVYCLTPGHVAPGILVREIMTPRPSCLDAGTSLLELVSLFHEQQFRHLLVTDEAGRLVGVISDRDVIRRFPPGESPDEEFLRGITAAEIMSTDVVSIESSRPVAHALQIMFDFGIHCLPVVDAERLVGILTSTDLYAVLQVLLDPAWAASRAESSAAAPCGR